MGKPRKNPRIIPRHFLKEWREFRGKGLKEAATFIPLSEAQLNRIENGIQPYKQAQLERLAILYQCQAWQLVAINPLADIHSLSIYEYLSESTREQIKKIADLIGVLLKP